MADEADLAQALIPDVNTSAISARFSQPSEEFCRMCGDDIPEKRQALGGVKYCVYCQEDFERKKH